MLRSAIGIGALVGLFVLSLTGLLRAAEVAVPTAEAPAAVAPPPQDCGPCGCLQVTYVYHAELQSTYGLGFDPRNYDTTEPHFYLGPVRPYPHYFVDGVPVSGGSC
jgi:hypothetical protein